MTTFLECCHRVAQAGTVLLLQSGVLLLLGLACGWALRRRGPSAQSLAYRATLLAVLGAALLAALPAPQAHPLWRVSLPVPQAVVRVPIPTPPVPADTPAAPLPALLPSRSHAPIEAATPLPRPAISVPPAPAEPPPLPILAWLYGSAVAVWAAGTCAALGWLGVGQASLVALRRRSAPLTTGPAADALQRLCDAHSLRPLPLLISAHVRSPFLAGLWRPAVFLPHSYAGDLDGPALRAVLAHELAHHERRDNAWRLLARLSCAVLWVNPLAWVISRRMEQSAEEACDAMALESGCAPRAYADCLLHLAQRLTPSCWERAVGLGVVPFRSSVGRRIQSVLHSAQRAPLPPFVRATIAVGAVLGVLLGSWLVSAADTPNRAADVVRQYLQACADGKLSQAYSLLSARTREYVPSNEFTGRKMFGPGYHFRPPPNPADEALDAVYELFTDPRHIEGYRYDVIGAAPDAANVVLIRAYPLAGPDAQNGILLRIVTTADAPSGNAPRLDLLGTAVPIKPDVTQRLESRKEQVKCAQNLRDIGLALLECVQHHNERFPSADHWVDAILPYVKDKSIFHDPSAPASQQFSYAFNRNLSKATLAQLDHPAETTMVFESSKGVKNANDTGQSLPHPGRHLKAWNFLYADGHTKYLRLLPSFSLRGGFPASPAATGAPAGGVIIGHIRYADGRPAGIPLIAHMETQSMSEYLARGKTSIADINKEHGHAVSGADGFFRLSALEPGHYDVIETDSSGKWVAAARMGIVIKPGVTVHVPDPILTHGAVITGSVLNKKTGRPILGGPQGPFINVLGPRYPAAMGGSSSAYVDSHGHYALRLSPGDNWVFLSGGWDSSNIGIDPANNSNPKYPNYARGFHVLLREGETKTVPINAVRVSPPAAH